MQTLLWGYGGTTNVERQKSARGPRYYTKGVSPMKKKLAELAKRSVAKHNVVKAPKKEMP